MELNTVGTIVCVDTHAPTERELHTCPHIVLSSPHPWDPHSIKFPKCKRSLDEMVRGVRNVSNVTLNER